MKNNDITYHIIGGGISGLSCAYFIKQQNKNIKTIIYEACSYLGGRTYSLFDENFGLHIDNALHLVLGSDKFMSRFVRDSEWCTRACFYNNNEQTTDFSIYKNRDTLLQIFSGNTIEEIASPIKRRMFFRAFPFTKNKCKFWFSNQNINQRIINLLSAYADEIYTDCKLQKILSQFGVAAQLQFNKTLVDIGAKDKVILAVDNISCSKILDVFSLEHNQIINIIYHTSQTIFLPRGVSFVGIKNGSADAVLAKDNLLTAIINTNIPNRNKLSDLAVKVWTDLDKIRGVNSAFIPPYKAISCKNAMICHNAVNNDKRPSNALTKYPNVFIAGDWTMKNYLCCMETAVKSANRAVKTALKSAR